MSATIPNNCNLFTNVIEHTNYVFDNNLFFIFDLKLSLCIFAL